MRKKSCWILLTAVLMLAIVMARVGKASPEPPVIEVEPKNNTGEPGETFSVKLVVAGIVLSETPPDVCKGLFGWEALLTFDPDVINVVNVTQGPFLEDAASAYDYEIIFIKEIDNSEGSVTVGETMQPKLPPDDPYPPEGATGNGTLATIAFEIKGEGATDIRFETPTTVAKTNLYTVWTNNIVQIPYTAKDGVFDNRTFVFSTELIVAIVVVVVVISVATVFFYRRRKASAGT